MYKNDVPFILEFSAQGSKDYDRAFNLFNL